jgi:hypothetical protein
VNTEDLTFLADHASTITGQRPERLGEVRARIRTARRRRAVGAVAGVAAVTAAIVAIAVVAPESTRDSGPVTNPLPTVKPIEEPPGQTAITADFAPQAVVHGNVPIGSAMSKDGETALQASLPYYANYAAVVGYCRGSEDIWWAANGNYGRCSPDAALEPTAPEEFQPIGNAPRPLPEPPGDQELFVDMRLTGPLPASARHCIANSPDPYTTTECLTSDHGVTLLENADATFGFTAYVHSAPDVVDDPLGIEFEALANLDGTDYLFTQGVASAPGSDTVATYLDVSEQPRLVLFAIKPGQAHLQLRVDGEPAEFPELAAGSPWLWGFGEIAGRAVVPPGSHNVAVDVPEGARAELLVYEAGTQPSP